MPFDVLLEKGFATLPIPDAPFARGGFPTPSGRCEFFSARLAAQGLDGLPDHLPNHEPAGSDHRYPLAMISPPARNFLNSSFVNVKSLRDIEGEPLVEMHADDAAARALADAIGAQPGNVSTAMQLAFKFSQLGSLFFELLALLADHATSGCRVGEELVERLIAGGCLGEIGFDLAAEFRGEFGIERLLGKIGADAEAAEAEVERSARAVPAPGSSLSS